MSTDMKPRSTVLRGDRKTVTQRGRTPAVSVFNRLGRHRGGRVRGEGPEAIAYLRELLQAPGLLTDKPVTGPTCNLQRPWEAQ